jgi:hypothetical protein
LLVAAVVLYIAFLPLWWLTLDAISWFAAVTADLVYHFFDPHVTINADAKIVRVAVALPEPAVAGDKPYQLPLRMDSVTYGLPMLAALIAVTRAETWAAKLRALSVGLLTMLLLSVPVVMLWAKLASLQLEERLAQETRAAGGDRASVVYYVFHGYAFSQPVVAIAVWLALVMLGMFKAKAGRQAPAAITAVARNAPCPCGSRRKYKRCCGRA